jgi:parallel beta-helix repeat protein
VFEGGAKINYTTVTGTTPVIQITNSSIFLEYPSITGSGVKGNGVGIKIGDPAAGQPNAVHILQPKLDNLNTGIEFGVQTTGGTESTGDCVMFGGRIRNCVVGVKNAGFVNYIYSPFISECSIGIQQTTDRNSGRFVAYSPTINQWSDAAIDIQRGRGTTVLNMWAEHTAVQSAVPTEVIRVGSASYTVVNFTMNGISHLHPIDSAVGTPELYVLRIVNAEGAYIEHLEVTNELPSVALVRVENASKGNVIERISFGDAVPAGYNANSYLSNVASTGDQAIVVRSVPNIAGSTAGSSLGRSAVPRADATATVFRDGTTNTYYTKLANGHVAYVAADTATTSGFKAVLGYLLPNGTTNKHISFAPNTRFHFLDAPLGNESWAGVEDHINFADLRNIVFSGGGWSTILSNRSNWSTGTDVEVLDFTNSQGIQVKDLQVECCGAIKTTTGAIDFDQGVDCVVENVRILRTRGAQAIVFDGGDAGKYAGRNRVSNCVIQGRPRMPELGLVSGGSLAASTEYRYCVSWVDMDLGGAGIPAETMPSTETSLTTDASNRTIDVTIQPGPYTCTARKVYRWDATNGWRLIATISDNTTYTYRDNGSATPSAVPTAFTEHRSTIMGSGFELLSCQDSTIEGCLADGVGDKINGINQYSYNIVRKGTLIGSNRNRIINCESIHSGGHGIRIAGGSDNIVNGCTIVNPGTVASKAQFIRIEGITGTPTDRNIIMGCRGIDNQTTASPSGGVSTNNAITVTATATPTNNQIAIVTVSGQASTAISDAGTGTVQTAVVTT